MTSRVRVFLLFVGLALIVVALPSAAQATSARIALSPAVGPPTTTVRVAGMGFGPGEAILLAFDSSPVGTTTASGTGRFLSTMVVPAAASPGSHTVSATGGSTGSYAQAPFTVRTDWTKFHFDPPDTGWNPYENVISPSNVGSLAVKWATPMPGPITGSPAVVSGIVYVGVAFVGLNNSYLYALDSSTGAVLWSQKQRGGGLPYDPTLWHGTVYLGTLDDHRLRAYDAVTGAVKWVFQAPGAVTDPTVMNGVLYFSVNSGFVYALDPVTGVELWETSLHTGIAPRALALSNSLIYVGADNSKLHALDASTGALVWSAPTGGQIFSSAAVSGGRVFVGSIDHSLYAFDAATGAFLWKLPTGNNVDSSPAVAKGIVFVGSGDGSVYAAEATTGVQIWRFPTGGPIAQASPILANGVVYIGSEDGYLYALNARTGAKLWSYPAGYFNDTPAVADGVLYGGSFGNTMYAFQLPS